MVAVRHRGARTEQKMGGTPTHTLGGQTWNKKGTTTPQTHRTLSQFPSIRQGQSPGLTRKRVEKWPRRPAAGLVSAAKLVNRFYITEKTLRSEISRRLMRRLMMAVIKISKNRRSAISCPVDKAGNSFCLWLHLFLRLHPNLREKPAPRSRSFLLSASL